MKKIIYILTFMLNAKVGSSKSTIKKKKMDVDELTDELTIYIIPPPYPLNFRSPGSLAKSLWKNAIVCMFRKYKHPMGHLVVHLASKEKGHDIYTGSIMKNKFHAFFTIIRTGMGYGTMLHSFKGKEDDEKKVYKEIEERKAKGNITFVKFKLDSSTYNKLYNFYQDCKDIELHKNYGAALDPLKGEGAGCSSYGV
ncbi:MAG: hypothetical protein NTX03_10435, partial [Bacteroidetes bacterium]|nr:hypothetical protein [Bacteroidota bacterium]